MKGKNFFWGIRIVLFFVIALLTVSCSYRIVRTYDVPVSKSIDSGCGPLIFKGRDMYGIPVKYLGQILLDDAGSTIHCKESDAQAVLTKEACAIHASVINVFDERTPSLESTCYRCMADLYDSGTDPAVQKIILKSERKKILYDDKHLLDWSDFTFQHPDSINAPYRFISNISLDIGNVSAWGKYSDFKTIAYFYSDVSSVRPGFAVEKNKTHIDMLFYLTQLYAKKLEVLLNSAEKSDRDAYSIRDKVDQCAHELYQDQQRYCTETKYGQNQQAQQKWNEQILQQLDELHIAH